MELTLIKQLKILLLGELTEKVCKRNLKWGKLAHDLKLTELTMEMSQSVNTLGLIDNELERISRQIISSTEVSDLTDIRLALIQSESVEKHAASAV